MLFLVLCLALACSDVEPVELKSATMQHEQVHKLDAPKLEAFNDGYELDTAYIKGHELWIEVGYSGGCDEHAFMVAWPEAITMIYPPDFGITLHHNANGDLCEAYIQEILKIDLTHTPVGDFDPATIAEMRLTVINGSKPEEMKASR